MSSFLAFVGFVLSVFLSVRSAIRNGKELAEKLKRKEWNPDEQFIDYWEDMLPEKVLNSVGHKAIEEMRLGTPYGRKLYSSLYSHSEYKDA